MDLVQVKRESESVQLHRARSWAGRVEAVGARFDRRQWASVGQRAVVRRAVEDENGPVEYVPADQSLVGHARER